MKSWKSRALVVATESVLVPGMLLAGAGVAGATVSHHAARIAARAIHQAETHPAIAPNIPAPSARVPAAANGVSSTGSYNWGGYADTSTTEGTFTAVSASWTVPKLTCTKEQRLSSDWVGIDGYADSTVEQDGTAQECFEGQAVYYDWYEMYPAGTIEEHTVNPGDKMTASVKVSGTTYTLAVTDATTPADNFSITETCAASTCLRESAEWIVERPSYSTGITPFAEISESKFTAASVTASGKVDKINASGLTTDKISMIDSTASYDLDTTSGLTNGNAFNATWLNSF